MFVETTCNSTLEKLIIEPGSEKLLIGPLTFHDLALVIGGSFALVAIFLSLYLAFMHAINYTKPNEQRHIIRILFMIPVYATSSFLQIYFYRHAIYFQVMSDCYEAFAIASFFALMCHYVAPDLHQQKDFFRDMYPVKPWVWPLSWFSACCCGQRGPWRTPTSGLTWFNINWIGVYHYCFIRVAMTITAVVTQYFDRYCESSNSPVFSHIWVLSINCVAVTIAMYCIIQFYVQMKKPLKEHRPFLKVLAIKLVVFLSFWQITAVSVATNERFKLFEPNHIIAYPDIKVGSPAAVLCIEMAFFAILHLWAYPYAPYVPGARTVYYPSPDERTAKLLPQEESLHQDPCGGTLGVMAFLDAMNPWDFVKAFGRGMRWLFYGVKHRKLDAHDKSGRMSSWDLDNLTNPKDVRVRHARSTEHLPIADQFRRSKFGLTWMGGGPGGADDGAGLIAHAQPNPTSAAVGQAMSTSQHSDSTSQRGVSASLHPNSASQRGVSASLHPDSASRRGVSASLHPDSASRRGVSASLHPDSASYRSPSTLHPDSAWHGAPSTQRHESASYDAPSYGAATHWSSSSPYYEQAPESFNRTRGGQWEPSTPGGAARDFGRAF